MENVCSNLTAIIVGTARQKIIEEVTTCLERNSITCKVCEGIYSAAAAIVTAPFGVNLLVIGYFETLAAEEMQFFSLAPKDGKISFCCFIKCFETGHNKLKMAPKNNVFLISSIEQMADVIKQCRGGQQSQTKGRDRDFASRIASLADSFFLTQAEQDALLGNVNNKNG